MTLQRTPGDSLLKIKELRTGLNDVSRLGELEIKKLVKSGSEKE